MSKNVFSRLYSFYILEREGSSESGQFQGFPEAVLSNLALTPFLAHSFAVLSLRLGGGDCRCPLMAKKSATCHGNSSQELPQWS